MTYYCEVCGQIKDCTRRDYIYPIRHFEINCDDCHEEHMKEVQIIRDKEKLESIIYKTMKEKELKEKEQLKNAEDIESLTLENKKLAEKLTEAKRIISSLYTICVYNYHYPKSSFYMKQAEQFFEELKI